MKMPFKAFCLFLLLGTGTLLNAQVSFPTDSARWGHTTSYYIFPSPPMEVSFFYFLLGDTVLGGTTYSRVYQSPHIPGPAQPWPIDTANSTYLGGIREDANQKVWFRGAGPAYPFQGSGQGEFNPNQERLLYNFNAQVGDTMNLYFPDYFGYTGGVHQALVQIDTVVISGITHRRFLWDKRDTSGSSFGLGLDSQIEGLGSINDLFFPYNIPFEEGYQLDCFHDGQRSYGQCNLAATEDPLPSLSATVYPQPAGQEARLRIEGDLLESIQVEVFDLFGRRVSSWTTSVPGVVQLGNAQLPPGTYLYRLNQSGKSLGSGQFVVQ